VWRCAWKSTIAATILFCCLHHGHVAMGIFIQTTSPRPPGTLLNLALPKQDGARLDVDGRSSGSTTRMAPKSIQSGMGVQFVDLTPDQRDQILALVRTSPYLSDDEETIRGKLLLPAGRSYEKVDRNPRPVETRSMSHRAVQFK